MSPSARARAPVRFFCCVFMELRLHDFRDRWRQGEHTVPLRIGSEIPFSAEGLHAMRVGGCGGAGRGGGGGAAARVTPATDAAAFGAAHHQDYSFAHESPQGRQWFRSFGTTPARGGGGRGSSSSSSSIGKSGSASFPGSVRGEAPTSSGPTIPV